MKVCRDSRGGARNRKTRRSAGTPIHGDEEKWAAELCRWLNNLAEGPWKGGKKYREVILSSEKKNGDSRRRDTYSTNPYRAQKELTENGTLGSKIPPPLHKDTKRGPRSIP